MLLCCAAAGLPGMFSVNAGSLEDKAAALESIPLTAEERRESDFPVEPADDLVTAAEDSDILDFPGRRDGEVIGEVLQYDELLRTGTVNGVWSQILFLDENDEEKTGYIPSNILEGYEEKPAESDNSVFEEKALTLEGKALTIEEDSEGGILHEGTGNGVFADAVTEVTETGDMTTVQIGTPVAASSDASLIPLGVFRITHYCPCSICCGPYTDGITSTGVTATTNHTIAVYPQQIPYGSKVVINGQVYVAEDCGGGIKENCIDIYVATHQEGEDKGVYYTDVYLLQ